MRAQGFTTGVKPSVAKKFLLLEGAYTLMIDSINFRCALNHQFSCANVLAFYVQNDNLKLYFHLNGRY